MFGDDNVCEDFSEVQIIELNLIVVIPQSGFAISLNCADDRGCRKSFLAQKGRDDCSSVEDTVAVNVWRRV